MIILLYSNQQLAILELQIYTHQLVVILFLVHYRIGQVLCTICEVRIISGLIEVWYMHETDYMKSNKNILHLFIHIQILSCIYICNYILSIPSIHLSILTSAPPVPKGGRKARFCFTAVRTALRKSSSVTSGIHIR